MTPVPQGDPSARWHQGGPCAPRITGLRGVLYLPSRAGSNCFTQKIYIISIKHYIMPQNLCRYCGRSLIAESCGYCGGSGEKRNYLFFKKTCDACNGSGVIYRCPNWINHITTGLSSPLSRTTHITTPNLNIRRCPKGHVLDNRGFCPTCAENNRVGQFITDGRNKAFSSGLPPKH